MSTLEASILFSVELKKFHNVDLFQRGYYQVRSYLKIQNSKTVAHIEKPVLSHFIRTSNLFDRTLTSGTVYEAETERNIPAKAVSKTLHVIYKQDELVINEVFDHKVHLQVNVFDFEVDIFKAGLTLCIELWFTDTEQTSLVSSKLSCVSTRDLKLHFIASRGLHYHVPVFFDYFHLCVVDMTIHGILTNMGPQLTNHVNQSLTPLKSSDNSSFKRKLTGQWNTLLFGTKNQSKKQLALSIHAHLCRILLSAYESLLRHLSDYIECLPSSKRALIVRNTDCLHRLTRLVSVIQNCSTEEDISSQVARDIYKLTSDLKTLISKFVDIVTLQPGITELLKLRSHNQKMKRMSEAFFTQDSSSIYLLAIYDPNTVGGSEQRAALVRLSAYLRRWPALPVEIAALDATPSTVPIIFEEVFQNEDQDDDSDIETESNDCGGSSSIDQSDTRSNSNPSKLSQSVFKSKLIALDRPLSKTSRRDNACQHGEVSLVGYRKYTESSSPYISSSSSSSKTTFLKDSDSSKSEKTVRQPTVALGTFKKGGLPTFNRELYPATIPSTNVFTRNRRLSDSDAISTKPYFAKSMPDLTINSAYDASEAQKTFESFSKLKKRHVTIDSELTNDNFSSSCNSQNTANGWSSVDLSSDESEDDISEISTENSNENAQMSIIDLLKDEHRRMTSRKKASMKREKLLKKLSSSTSALNAEIAHAPRLVSPIMAETLAFLNLKEQLRRELLPYQGRFYSDNSSFAAHHPYFSENVTIKPSQETHLVVCVHGLDGNSSDLRLVRTYIQLALPEENMEFLMSERIQGETFMDFDSLQKSLVSEIKHYIDNMPTPPGRISFIGHSMGCILIRAVLTNESMRQYLPKLHAFLSLSGPHLGTVYNSSSLVNMGMWVMQKWKKSNSLLQLAMRDHEEPRRCYLYWLSEQAGLEHFRYVLLVSSQQDKYVPYHSTRIELCKAAIKDNSEMGMIYMEMVTNILQRVIKSRRSTVIRYDVYHSLDSSANSYIGRAAHIAVLDSEIFLEKFICVCAANYFR